MAGADDIPAFRSMRTLRALRPLRAVSRWEGMRVSTRRHTSPSDAIGVYSVALLIALTLKVNLNIHKTHRWAAQPQAYKALTVRCLSQRRPTSLTVLPGALDVVMLIVDASISLTTTHATSSTWFLLDQNSKIRPSYTTP